MTSIKIKTLQQKTFEIDIEHTETVRALKDKIEAEKGVEFQADLLKLIYAGKILEDSQPLTKYKIQPNGFVVVMVSKSRPPPKPVAEEKPSETTATSEETATATQETTTQESTETSQPPGVTATTSESEEASRMETSEATPTVTPPPQGSDTTDSRSEGALLQAGSTLVTGQDLEEASSNLMALGFEHDLVMRALNASFNNPDRAAEMLMSGTVPDDPVPAPPERMEPGEPGEQPSRDIPPPQGEGQSASGQQPGNPFEFLRDRPQFQLLRSMVQQNPSALYSLLQQLGTSNPQLLQLISSNQQAFIDMLNMPPTAGSGSASASGPAPPPPSGEIVGGPPQIPQGLAGLPQGMPPPDMMPPGAVSIQVTPEEKESIEKLKALGFSEHDVIQAYIACDKNEELAANFLLGEK